MKVDAPLPLSMCGADQCQAATDSARQLSVAHAHAGAIELMTGNSVEAAMLFGCQLDEARKASQREILHITKLWSVVHEKYTLER